MISPYCFFVHSRGQLCHTSLLAPAAKLKLKAEFCFKL